MTELNLKGAKGGGGSSFTQTPDNLRSEDTFEGVLGIGIGPMKGPVNGLKGVKVNGTAVENATGERNYGDFVVNIGDGDPTKFPQPIELKLGGGAAPTQIGLDIPNTFITRTLLNTNANFIDLRFVAQQLYKQTDKGIFPQTATLQINIKPAGATNWVDPTSVAIPVAQRFVYPGRVNTNVYEPLVTDYYGLDNPGVYIPSTTGTGYKITGKTTQPSVHELRISVPNTGAYAGVQWDVRVKLVEAPSFDSADGKTIERRTIQWESIAAVYTSILGTHEDWRGVTWMQVVGKANAQLTGVPEMTGVWDTKIVSVPPASVFNPDTQAFTSTIWDGSWAKAFTRCPSWIINDAISDSLSGLSLIAPGSYLNKWDALEASKWFGAQVPNGAGGTHPRYTMNIATNEVQKAEDFIRYLAGAVGGLAWDQGDGEWRMRVDKPEVPVDIFTLETIEGEFSYGHTDVDTRYNDITMAFKNEEMDFREDRVRVFDNPHIARFGRKLTTMVAVGCTNRQEALRRAKLRLESTTKETRIVNFSTNRRGRNVNQLDMILIADGDLGDIANRSTGRTIAVAPDRLSVTLRDTVRLELGVAYTLNFASPNPNYALATLTQPVTTDWRMPTIAQTRTIMNTSGQRGNVTTLYLDTPLPADIADNLSVSLSATGLTTLPKLYRVLNVLPDPGGERIGIAALEVNTAKWDASDNVTNASTIFQDLRGAPQTPLGPVSGPMLKLIRTATGGGGDVVTLFGAFERPSGAYINGFKVEYSLNGGPSQTLSEISPATSFELVNPSPGTYEFRVYTINRMGALSLPLVSTLVVTQALIDAAVVTYNDGTPVQAVQPAQAGADITATHTSADTAAVGGRVTATVLTQLDAATSTNATQATRLSEITVQIANINAVTPTEMNNAVAAAQSAASSAGSSSTSAAAARDAAQTAKTQAETALASANISLNDSITARNAAQSAQAAAVTSASQANGFATNASTSANAAAGSVTSASASATAAATSASNASTSASNAATSATNALGSSSSAATSASTAAGSATGAANSASAAATSATSASTSNTNAGNSATAAASSATAANTSAGNASTSASQAATSSTNALGSANAASTSASTAATQAGNAATSASAAATSASAASTSQTAAGSSATSAATSATNASTSAGNASTSATAASSSATSALGSANAASTSSGVAASARDAARAAAVVTLPSTFVSDGLFFTNQMAAPLTDAFVGQFLTVAGIGRVYQPTNATAGEVAVGPKGLLPAIGGHTLRITTKVRMLTASNNGNAGEYFAHFIGADAAGDYQSALNTAYVRVAPTVANGWVTQSFDYVVPGNVAVPYIRARVGFNPGGAGGSVTSYGPELATNGTFSSNSAPPTIDGTSSISGGVLTSTGGIVIVAWSGILVVGKNYRATFDRKKTGGANGNGALRLGNGPTNGSNPVWTSAPLNVSATFTTETVDFTALATGFQIEADTAVWVGQLDNISIKEIIVTTTSGGANADFQIALLEYKDVTTEAAAAASATAAATSASTASTSQTAAGNSATAAAASAVTAQSGATNASNSASAAASSASAASSSQTAAGNSATSASGSANTASTGATNAANSATAASTSASNASASQTAAGNSATSAAGSATSASTSSGNASTSAGQASTSASGASSSASAAATSATNAASYRDTANTYAGQAATSASNASTSSAGASASAAAAASSATLSAKVGRTAVNENPIFSDWPTGQQLPTTWESSNYLNASPVYGKVAGINGPYGIYQDGILGQRNAFIQTVYNFSPGTYVFEVDVKVVSGNLGSTLVYFSPQDGNNANLGIDVAVGLADIGDINGVISGSILGVRRFSRIITFSNPNIRRMFLLAMTHAEFAGTQVAVGLEWHKFALRPASDAEAQVTTISGAVATLQGRTTAYWQTEVVAGLGNGATAFISARAETSPGVSTSQVSFGAREVHIYNPQEAGWKKAVSIVGGDVSLGGNLTVESGIFLGSGAKWRVQLATKSYSATDGNLVQFGLDLGAVPNVTFAGNNLVALAAGEVYSLYVESITNTAVVVRFRILTPGVLTPYRLTSYTVNGTGPTVQIDKNGYPSASDNMYTLAMTGTFSDYAYNDGGGGTL